MSEKEHHRVHFPEKEDTFGKDNEITFQGSPKGDSILVHLGFLQIGHRYHITVEIPLSLCNFKEPIELAVRDCQPGEVHSINCKVIDISRTDIGYLLKIEFLAYKEKLLKEQLYLESLDHKTIIKLLFMARILGKGKGTPLLRNGIHCIGIELEDESEASDWQGFD